MANPDTSGKETSEHAAMQSAQNWIKIGAGLVVAIVTALLSGGVIPEDSVWISVLTILGTVGAAIGGVSFTANKYIGGRSAIKVHKVVNEGKQ